MIFLFGIQQNITDNIILFLANTLLFLCGQVADIRPRQTAVWCYLFGDDINRKSCGEYPQLKPHVH